MPHPNTETKKDPEHHGAIQRLRQVQQAAPNDPFILALAASVWRQHVGPAWNLMMLT